MSNSTACSKQPHSQSNNKWAPEKIWRVARDIKDSPKVNLLSLLIAFLARMLSESADSGVTELSYPEAVEQSTRIINTVHHNAITFCKDKKNKNATGLKKHLRKYRETKGECRRSALCNALNITLSEFRDKPYGDLPLPSQRDDKEELIFIPNNSLDLESEHIAQHMPKSKRAPDILATSTSTLRKYYGHHKSEFDDWMRLVDGVGLPNVPGTSKKPHWLDVLQPWELAAAPVANTGHASGEDTQKVLHTYNLRTRSDSRQRQNSRKRRSEEEPSGKNKKARVESNQETKPFRLQVADEKSNLLPELRCAYYGVEQLTSAWNIDYSTVVLLEDTKLSLRWYDAQGCFGSEEIDIMEEMPVFVVFLVILQRFDSRMWGLSPENVDHVEVGEEQLKLEEERGRFELIGRRTFGCKAACVSKMSNEEENIPLFFKSSWVKCKDPKEPDIIKIAHQRANKLLPEKYQKMVTDHVPTVVASRVSVKASTACIRRLVQEVDGSIQFSGEARTRVWMVTHQLEQSQDLDPPTFYRVFWETLRCHYLLWKLGIAHRDISISNLMCAKRNGDVTGILNDYDLAILMEPGSRNPETDGYERGGTTSFMAMDLFDYRDAKLKRWYRHDLESFAWCLLWNMLKSRAWSEGSPDDNLTMRRSFMFNLSNHLSDVRKEWHPYFMFVMTWFNNWRDAFQEFDLVITTSFISTWIRQTDGEKIALRDAGDAKKQDQEYVQFIVGVARQYNGHECGDFMQDTSWIFVEIHEK